MSVLEEKYAKSWCIRHCCSSPVAHCVENEIREEGERRKEWSEEGEWRGGMCVCGI